MSHYRDAFETLAERGSPRGAQALLDRMEGSTPVLVPLRAHRRLRGPAAAFAAFVLVLLAGGTLFLLRPGGAANETVDAADIVWREFPEGVMGFAAGPGGFIGEDRRSGSLQIVFSSDGVTWTPVEFPREAGYQPPSMAGPPLRMVVANETRWLGIGPEIEVTWTSTNGRDWSLVEVPDELMTRFRDVTAGGEMFLATISDPFDEQPPTLWRLREGSWERLTPAGLPEGEFLFLEGNDTGFVAYAQGDDGSFSTWASEDGSAWTPGTTVVVDPVADEGTVSTSIVAMRDDWVALSTSYRDDVPMRHVRTSTDGLHWQLQPDPPFSEREMSFYVQAGGSVIAVVGNAAWSTEDGASWKRLHTFDSHAMWAMAATVDGRTVVLYEPEKVASENSVTTIVMASPVDEPDPAGTTLQDEILADGTVTRAEYESAVAAMVACMEERGVTGIEWKVAEDGGLMIGYESIGDADAVHSFCDYSYRSGLVEAFSR